MHAGAPLSWKPVAPHGKMQKSKKKILKNKQKFNTYACMHAGASLSWKPVALGINMRKN